MTERRENSALRNGDESMMRVVSSFLDTHLYPKETNSFERCEDKETQVKGIDVKFKLNGSDFLYNCDEKSAVRYINKGLKTFSLELSFINRANQVQDGWLVTDKEGGTNSYMLIWVDKSDYDVPTSPKVLHDVEVCLVKKKSIMDYLASIGWTKENLMTKCANIRNNPYEYMGNIYTSGCKFSFSQQLVEQPINIILPRETYRKIADLSKRIVV